MAPPAVAIFGEARLGTALGRGDRRAAEHDQPAVALDRGLEAVAEDGGATDPLGPREVPDTLDVGVAAAQPEGVDVVLGQPEGLVVDPHVVHHDVLGRVGVWPGEVAVEVLQDPDGAGGAVVLQQGVVLQRALEGAGGRGARGLAGGTQLSLAGGGAGPLAGVVEAPGLGRGAPLLGAGLSGGRGARPLLLREGRGRGSARGEDDCPRCHGHQGTGAEPAARVVADHASPSFGWTCTLSFVRGPAARGRDGGEPGDTPARGSGGYEARVVRMIGPSG